MLFDPKFVYPSDDVGAYMDLEGIVVGIENRFGSPLEESKNEKAAREVLEEKPRTDGMEVKVQTRECGVLTAFFYRISNSYPEVGFKAKIRVYESRPGFYPDPKLMSWGRM
jgi:hypothetical protein